eukprot:gene16650-18961_t
MDDEEFESIIIANDGDEEREEKSESLRLKRLQYYQNYTQQNHPDNPDSSDDEGNIEKRNERGSVESKSAADDNSDFDDFDDAAGLENQYAPLEEDQEEFGDFVTTNASLESRMIEIDSMLNTDNPDDLEKNMMFNRLLGEDRRYIRTVPSTQVSNPQDNIEVGATDSAKLSEEEDQGIRKLDQKDSKSNESTSYRSIAPLTQEKVQKIKDIMAGIKIKPPTSIGTLALLDSMEHSRMRLGDELSLEK